MKPQLYLSKLAAIVTLLLLWTVNVQGQTTVFTYNGGQQTYTVPVGVTSLYVDAIGGGGGYPYWQCGNAVQYAAAGRVQCNLGVTPGQVLYIYVGGAGGSEPCSNCAVQPAGFNGGQSGGSCAGASGGATDIRFAAGTVAGTTVTPYTSSNRVVVAGGGGGGADYYGFGGSGGGLVGGTGIVNATYGGVGGTGGTQTSGGSNGNAGSLGVGGARVNYGTGGGGYWGGASGTGTAGGGGGGSSYTDPTICSAVTHTQGYAPATGNGVVTLCPGPNAGTVAGSPLICVGTSTTLSNSGASGPGVWGTSSPRVSVNPSTGVVTGLLVGTAVVSYTVNGSCTFAAATIVVQVNGTPSNITGPVNVCAGSAITLSNPDGVGTWTSSNPSVATIGGATGIVNGITAGSPVISYQSGATGCYTYTNISVTSLPSPFAVSPTGGNYCAGTTAGVPIGLSGSTYGINYQLFYGSTAVGAPVTGAGPGISFGNFTAVGTYSVMATDPSSGCTSNMTGSATVGTNPAPNVNNVIVVGGGASSYCAGGTGVQLGLNGSQSGINYRYQMYNNGVAEGLPVTGTGGPISFGYRTGLGSRTVIASNLLTGCVSNQTGAINVTINTLPSTFNVTGGGSYCTGAAGVDIGLSGSSTGVNYQLYNNYTSTYGPTLPGTGSALVFSNITAPGNYSIIATNTTTNCTMNMSGVAAVAVTPLPTVYSVTGSGSYCIGGIGLPVTLSNSDLGVNYEMRLGSTLVTTAAGSGLMMNFGLQTAAGLYTIKAINAVTGCTSNMTGAASISINPLPTPKTVSGTGSYCAGGAGLDVTLASSVSGVNYQLWNGAFAVGSPVSGTGGTISFGRQTTPGTYTATAMTAATGCSNNMTGGATITINPLPMVTNVTGGGAYCAGGAGVPVGSDSSEVGVSYRLWNGSTSIGTMAGTGTSISYGNKTAAGNYTIVATNTTTGCVNNMAGSAAIAINPLPVAYSIVGGGSYCSGGTGNHIGLGYSNTGISYTLWHLGAPVAGPTSGLGSSLDFGLFTNNGGYTVTAVNNITGCTNNMTGTATISTNALPAVYTVSGGGSYCVGSNGVHVRLSGSTFGVKYQLYNGSSAVGSPVTGAGVAIDFGLLTTAGVYTVVAMIPATGCTMNMTGSATISVNSLPTVSTVTGGGSYCAGGAGLSIGLDTTYPGIDYTLSGAVTATTSGTGLPITFGTYTNVGVYRVTAVDALTGCTNTMSGTATITVVPLPIVYTVIGGGSYCSGGAGSAVMLSNSTSGVNYDLINGSVITTVAGTGATLNFGLQPLSGTYTVVARNATTGCTSNMSSSASIVINPNPNVDTVTGGGSYCAGLGGVHVGMNTSSAGINYQLMYGTAAVGLTNPGTGGSLDFGMKTAAGTYSVKATDVVTGCSSVMANNATISITPTVTPDVTVSSTISVNVCAGTPGVYSATPVNGGTPHYQWLVNGYVMGTDTSDFAYTPVNGDRISVVMTSNATCATPSTATSSTIVMTVNANVTPSVVIASNSPDTVCTGKYVLFTAHPTNGGSSAAYSWVKNATVVGTGLNYSTLVANGDVVSVIMASSLACLTTATDSATSNSIAMTVKSPVVPVVTVAANTGTHITNRTTVIFTATATGVTGTPTYQWMINNVPVIGANSNTYTASQLADADVVACAVSCTDICGVEVGKGSLLMSVRDVTAVSQVSSSNANYTVMPNPSKGFFTINGSLGMAVNQEVTIELTNMLGQVVYSSKTMSVNGSVNENVQLGNNISNGNYMLTLRSGSDITVIRLAIEQ